MTDDEKIKNLRKGLVGSVTYGYGRILLPLAMAHKLQEILAHAVKHETKWVGGDKSFGILSSLESGEVCVFTPNDRNFYDATELDYKKREEWGSACAKGLEEDESATPDNMIEPKVFLSMKG